MKRFWLLFMKRFLIASPEDKHMLLLFMKRNY